jgi:hypothetical protein
MNSIVSPIAFIGFQCSPPSKSLCYNLHHGLDFYRDRRCCHLVVYSSGDGFFLIHRSTACHGQSDGR